MVSHLAGGGRVYQGKGGPQREAKTFVWLIALCAVAGPDCRAARSATVLFCPFDSLAGWSVRTVGAGEAKIEARAEGNPCLAVFAHRASVLLSRRLPVDQLRGSRVSVGCLMRTEGVVAGPQKTSVAKIHLAVVAAGRVEHFAARLGEDSRWGHQGFTVDVPAEAERVILNLGLEGCSGRAWFDQLLVRNDRRGVYPLDLSPVANASHDQLGLDAFPQGTIQWEGIPFQIADPLQCPGGDCLRLKGIDHPDWPAATAAPIRVGRGATDIYILHGVLGGRQKSPTPCAMWTARFAGGHDAGLSVFEGRQVGPIGSTEDLENWRVAWRGEDETGRPITLGVTRWRLYANQPLLELTCRAYHGAPPVIVAVTVVEEPPPSEVESEVESFDEMGEAAGDGALYP